MRIIFGLTVVAGLTANASACINDVESPKHEREFRSNYGESPDYAPAPSLAPMPMASTINPKLYAIGGALLAVAFLLVSNRSTTKV